VPRISRGKSLGRVPGALRFVEFALLNADASEQIEQSRCLCMKTHPIAQPALGFTIVTVARQNSTSGFDGLNPPGGELVARFPVFLAKPLTGSPPTSVHRLNDMGTSFSEFLAFIGKQSPQLPYG
jgi:hypothetical protein